MEHGVDTNCNYCTLNNLKRVLKGSLDTATQTL